eukprot:m.997616 g.997616  ORF g.997616 m.997616 type:complete len:372 (+) comp24022_c1_seq24:70-1185(+)
MISSHGYAPLDIPTCCNSAPCTMAAAESDVSKESLLQDDSAEKQQKNKESLDWLRAHGVTVETPEDRQQIKAATRQLQSLKVGDAGTRTFQYVLIPAGLTDKIVECTGVVYSDERGHTDQLPALLAPSFAAGTVDAHALKSSNTLMAGGNNDGVFPALTPEAIAKQGGQAETFRLSNYVNMYLDAVGALKHLPINPRAADLASRCGYGQGVAFHGDIYVGRLQHSSSSSANTQCINVDFHVKEMDPGARWVQTAVTENLQRQALENRSGGMVAEEITHRGGDGAGYTWEQDPSDLEIKVPVPVGIKGKDITVKFAPASVKIAVKGAPIDLDLQLLSKVATDGCTWSLSDGVLCVSMEKATDGETWSALVKS